VGLALYLDTRLSLAMTWTPIKDTDWPANEAPLASGIGVDLETNVDHNLARRLKRFSVTYNLGPTSTTGGTPPAGDSTLVGPTLDVAGSPTSDTEAIGLKLSSPPTIPIAVPLGAWPLSARATSLRVVVSCTTANADVDLYAFAMVEGGILPIPPMLGLDVDEEGVVSFNSTIKALDAHATVGTSTPSAGTQNGKPVALSIDLSGARRDYGYAFSGDSVYVCRLFLGVLSSVGSLDSSLSQSSVSEYREGGRRITLPAHWNNTWGLNPGPLHRWLYFPGNADSELRATADSWLPKWRGVLQGRPEDLDAVGSSANSSFVIHPPIDTDSALRTDSDFQIYQVGEITIQSVSIQEVGT
jgi:hypothetical protein